MEKVYKHVNNNILRRVSKTFLLRLFYLSIWVEVYMLYISHKFLGRNEKKSSEASFSEVKGKTNREKKVKGLLESLNTLKKKWL